jgi:hypothetical protein
MATPRLSKLAQDYGGDLVLPIATLASGGSKIAAGMQLVGGVIVTKVLGPLGAVAGIISGIIVQLVKWEQTAQLVAKAMDKATARDAMTKQFAELTKSVATAKAKIQDLFQFASKAPFSFQSIIEGGRRLAEVSRGALITRANLILLGDSAAASGQQFATVADGVATLYDSLKNGQPVKESAEALRDMGVISEGAVEQLVSLQQSGAGLAVTMNAVTKSLEANKGAMAGVVQTVEDLQSKQEQIKASIITPAGQIFNDSQQKGLAAQNALLERLAPTLAVFFRAGARVSSMLGYLQSGIVGFIAKIPFLGAALTAVISAFAILSASAIGLSSIMLGKWLLDVTTSLTRYASAARTAAGATEALNIANGRIATGRGQLAFAAREGAVKAGFALGPQLPPSMQGLIAAEGLAGTKNLALGASARVGALGVNLLKEGVAYLAGGIRMLLLTPLGAAVTFFTAVGYAATMAADKFSTATEAINAMVSAANAGDDKMQQQISNIRTAADAAVAYAAAMDAVHEAQKNLGTVIAERSKIPFIGRTMDMLNQQATKEEAARAALGLANVRVQEIQKIQGGGDLANSEEFNAKDLANTIATDRARREEELARATPEERLNILSNRAAASKNEAVQKEITQKAITGLNDPRAIAAVLGTSGSREMREVGNLQSAVTPAQKQQAKNSIARTQALYGDPAGDQAALIAGNSAYAIAQKREGLEGKILDQQKDALLLDHDATEAAKDKVGLLQAQIDLIQNNNELSAQSKANAIEQLKITQLQVATEIYRNKVALDAQTKRTGAEAAMMRGQMAASRALQGQADLEEANQREKDRTAELTKQNMDSGQFASIEEAHAAAASTAAQERKNAALDSYLAKQRQLASMTQQTAVGPISPNTTNYFTAEEAAAARAAGFKVSPNQVQGENSAGTPPEGIPGQLGGSSPLDEPAGPGHHTMDSATEGHWGPQGRHFGMDEILGPVARPAMGTVKPTDPILTENQKQTGLLTQIAINTAKAAASKIPVKSI